MKQLSITITGQIKGQVTTYPEATFKLEAGKAGFPITKQLGQALKVLLSLATTLTAAKFILESNGKKQLVTLSHTPAEATKNILLNIAGMVFNPADFDRTAKVNSPILLDIVATFGLKGLKEVSLTQYQIAIKHRFSVLSKQYKIEKVRTLATVTTQADRVVIDAFKVMFPAKVKELANSTTVTAPKAEKKTRNKPAKKATVTIPEASEAVNA